MPEDKKVRELKSSNAIKFIMVDSNEDTDREKNREDRTTRTDQANVRAMKRLRRFFPGLQEVALTCGDINVLLESGKVLAIERKRAGDFLGSIGNGRIFKQVENMANNAGWSCIIVEGLISFDTDDMAVIPAYNKDDVLIGHEETQWRGVSVRGAMYAIQWSGCPIFTIEPHSLPNIIIDMANFCNKPSEHYQALGKHRYVTFPRPTISEEIIAAFPGIGMKRAKSLLEFAAGKNDNGVGTLAEALSWGNALKLIDRKSRPEGWGDKTIENFCAVLGVQTGEFLTVMEDKQQIQKGKKNGK